MDSPSPVPMPTGLVVKKGSKMRGSTSGGMPVPVSLTATTAWPRSSFRVAMRISLEWVRPSGMAWAALTSRLRNTWPSRVSSPSTVSPGA
jgi:hypothetical protein